MSAVLIENVSKSYRGDNARDIIAVENATLAIESGEFMVLVGPSGSGKSTMLRMIAGLEDITAGSIYMAGQRINDLEPKDRDIAMVFQNYALYPHMSAYQNMAFGLELRKYPKAEINRRVSAAAQVLGLEEETLQRRPKALSGGQRQRIALGRALVRQPKVFLFDEPLSNLDPKLRSQMRAEISKLHHLFAATMIYVTHDQVEAMTMGDRICVMRNGRIQQIAKPIEIYCRPSNLFVARFIGSPRMNILEGRIVEQSGRLHFSMNCAKGEPRLSLLMGRSREEELGRFAGREVILGFRPEDIKCAEDTSLTGGSSFCATLETTELLGPETHLYFRVGANEVVVRGPSVTRYRAGDEFQLVLDIEKAHIFEAANPELSRKANGDLDVEHWQAACIAIS